MFDFKLGSRGMLVLELILSQVEGKVTGVGHEESQNFCIRELPQMRAV